MERNGSITVAVIGGGQCSAVETEIAEEVGKELALRGVTLVCGGLGGVMEAACRGAASVNGLTIGILPGDDPAEANPFVKVPIATGVGRARNLAVVGSAQAVIAIDGDYGTLSEIAFALKKDLPVIGLNTWRVARGKQEVEPIVRANSPVDAVDKALALAKGVKFA